MAGACRALGVIGAVFGVALLGGGVASADGPVQLKSRLGDACLDAPSLIGAVVINPCNGSDSQRWTLSNGPLRSVVFPAQCLAQPGEASVYAHLDVCWDALGTNWGIQPNGWVTSQFTGCLTVLGGPGPGTLVSTRGCNGDAPEQGWNSVR